jgi:hypothetical protein
MNEQIKLLAIQAKYDARSNRHYLERVHNREITLEEYQEMYDQKFAELIVQDLIDSMIKRYGDDDELPIQEIKLFVKGHFGVEE